MESKPIYQFHKGDRLEITSVQVEGVMRRRLLDLGFVRGAVIDVVQKSPLGDPIAFRVFNTSIALRREESSLIHAVKMEEDSEVKVQ
ncbi:FeoA family protein [Bacillus piscicola]|uniref:FeoA family protein n=1 Tax=Bacillus piscicola TaxID=1632684 RepID=UPI001F08ECC9|nr:FeoA family protein [Bacillus piscicola]